MTGCVVRSFQFDKGSNPKPYINLLSVVSEYVGWDGWDGGRDGMYALVSPLSTHPLAPTHPIFHPPYAKYLNNFASSNGERPGTGLGSNHLLC